MGGMAAGDVASDVAVKTVLREATEMFASGKSVSTSEQTEGVKTWAMRANERVCAAMEERKVRGGCTLIVTCMIGSRLTIAHVGDCRLYHIRQRNITLLTRDHSLAMAMVLQGTAELKDIRQHPDRSRVTRSLGERQNVPDYFVDTLEPATGNATLELENGDTLLLCSDGLWEPVVDDEMRDAIARHAPDLSAAGEALLQIALERGGPDNATVVLLRVEEKPAYGED
jgi:protein phosphatase